jgi:hypothetical protein
MMSAGPFVAGLKCFWGIRFICMAKRDFAIHLITLHNILEYMQIAVIQIEAADFVKINICAIFKTFGHDCSYPLYKLIFTLVLLCVATVFFLATLLASQPAQRESIALWVL